MFTFTYDRMYFVMKSFKLTQSLDEAYDAAWQLTKTLRAGRVPFRGKNGVQQRNFEAYVFHDRYRSIVTIGSFDSPNDPKIVEYKKIFGAKMRTNPNTGKEVLIAEVMTLPDTRDPKNSLKTWIFDPQPRLIEVPRLK